MADYDVVYTCSVLKKVQVVNPGVSHYKSTWKKARDTYPPRYSAKTNANRWVVDLGSGNRVIQIAASGASFSDGFPSCFSNLVSMNMMGQSSVVRNFVFHCGINDLNVLSDFDTPAEIVAVPSRNSTAFASLASFAEQVVSVFPNAALVYLGTSGIRNKRQAGDFFNERVTDGKLRKRQVDISRFLSKVRRLSTQCC
jgi:hypothetical protein